MRSNQVVPLPVPGRTEFDGAGAGATSDTSSDTLLALRDTMLHEGPVEQVRLTDVRVSDTPRTQGIDGKWALTLAELETELPPIVVHRDTMSVIDGLHRLRAAQLQGREHIKVRYFEGSVQDAALLAVAMNIVQGRPLTQSDRAAAVERIVTTHPYWSDRAIAVIAGLSAKKVSEIRRRSVDPSRGERRIGLDGRLRPLNSVRGRELAGELLRADPNASLRAVARRAGISPVTVADVRKRILRGDDPVTPRQRGQAVQRDARAERPAPQESPETRSPGELFTIFESLRRDPSLRLTEAGRNILRMLEACSLMARERRQIISSLPPHCTGQMAALAGGYSQLWRVFAEELRAYEEEQESAGSTEMDRYRTGA
ncbi:ParB N-terminal domain-containing protein [Streptomyces sp. NPDC046939]|uniref:ParB N-terminal domain-containing protein n=1 Tax=Streptomyces sp. NPDC046939 TaxID=3155376 RepID=UPI0033D2F02C